MDEKSINKKKISELIIGSMNEQRITRKKISDDLQFKYTTLCDYVKGRTIPSLYDLYRIFKYLEIDILSLYEPINYKTTKSSVKVRLIEKEINQKRNIIKINDDEYVKKQEIERIIKL